MSKNIRGSARTLAVMMMIVGPGRPRMDAMGKGGSVRNWEGDKENYTTIKLTRTAR